MEKMKLDINLNPELDYPKLNNFLKIIKNSLGDLGKNIKMIDIKANPNDALKDVHKVEKELKGIPDKTVDIKANPADALRDIKKVENQLHHLNSQSIKAGGGLKNFMSGAGQMFAGGMMTNMLTQLTASIGQFRELAGVQEKAEKQLEQAYGRNIDSLKQYASALQAKTTFGDEAILQGQASLAAFIKDEEQLKLVTQATLDFAAAKGVDSKTAFDLFAKSAGTSQNALSRYGIEIEKGATGQDKINQLVAKTTELYGGAAEALAKTDSGKIQQVANSFGDMKELLGQTVNQLISSFAPTLMSLIDLLSKNVLPIIQDVITKIQPLVETIVNAIKPLLDGLLKGIQPVLDALVNILVPVINDLLSAFQPVFDMLPQLGQLFGDVLKAVQPLIAQFTKMGSEIFAKYVSQLLPPLLDLFKSMIPLIEMVANVGVSLLDAYKPIMDLFQDAFIAVLKGLIRQFQGFVDTIKDVVDIGESVIGFFNSMPPVIEEAKKKQAEYNQKLEESAETATGLKEAVTSAYNKIMETTGVNNAIAGIGTYFNNMIDGINEKANSIYSGIKEGLIDVKNFQEKNKSQIDAINKNDKLSNEQKYAAIKKLRTEYDKLNKSKNEPPKTKSTGGGGTEEKTSWDEALEAANNYITSTEQLTADKAKADADALANQLLFEFTMRTKNLEKTSEAYQKIWADLQQNMQDLENARHHKSIEKEKEKAETITDNELEEMIKRSEEARQAYNNAGKISDEEAREKWQADINAAEEAQKLLSDIYIAMGNGLEETFAAAISGQENAGKAVITAMFDMLQMMVPIWSAQILGGSLATPQSVITAGGWGLAQWAALTALIQGAVSAARGAMSFAEGGIADHPMLALVGDAKKSGNSSNAELILNQSLFGDMVDLILGRYTTSMDKYFGASLSVGKAGDVLGLNTILSNLNGLIDGIKPFMADLSSENILELIDIVNDEKYLTKLYDANEIAIEDYADKMSAVNLRMSGITGASYSDYSLIGSTALNQTEIINSPNLSAAVYKSAAMQTKEINNKLDEVQSGIVGALNSFEGRLHIIESDVANSVNHFNNKNSPVFKTRRNI